MPTTERTNFDEAVCISVYNELNNVVDTAYNNGLGGFCNCDICNRHFLGNNCYNNSEVYNGLSFMRWPFLICVDLECYGISSYIGCTCHFTLGRIIRICWSCFRDIYRVYYNNVDSNIDKFRIEITINHNDISHSFENIPDNQVVEECCDGGLSCRYCGRTGDGITNYKDIHDNNIFLCERCERNGNHLIHDYTYEPELTFYETIKDKRTELFYGIELEVEVLPEFRVPDVIKRLPDFTYVKSDSSINRGFEIVTHPATYNWLLEHTDDWQNILDIRNYGCRSYNTETCGMHIHMSKAAFGRHHLYRYLYFIYNPVNKIAISQISQRKDELLERWSGFNNDLEVIKNKAIFRNEVGDRHTAVGLGRRATVELRIFRGTLNPHGFWKNIEFAHALYNFTKDNGLNSMIWVMFIAYVKANKQDYPNLNKFLFCEQTETILNY